MKHAEIEAWALQVADHVVKKQPVEDARVELKSDWIDHYKAAWLIAGHANAARGDSLLWLIGVNEKKFEVVGADYTEISNWWAQVKTFFDGIHPNLTHLDVPYGDKRIAALFFQTDRAPYVVKQEGHASNKGDNARWEVPWREGTIARTARREDLLRILIPSLKAPRIEVLGSTLTCEAQRSKPVPEDEDSLLWRLETTLFIEPLTDTMLSIPFHRLCAELNVGSLVQHWPLHELKLRPPFMFHGPFGGHGQSYGNASVTIDYGPDVIVVRGPGRATLFGFGTTDLIQKGLEFPAHTALRIAICNSDDEINLMLEHILIKHDPDTGTRVWEYVEAI